ERLAYMIADSGCRLVISDAEHEQVLADIGDITIICPDREAIRLLTMPATPVAHRRQPHDLAYVIYTSGSTGRPKGVMVEDHSVVHLVAWQTNYFGIGSDERILQFSNYSFDASVEQIFLALLNGSALVLMQGDERLDREQFETLLVR